MKSSGFFVIYPLFNQGLEAANLVDEVRKNAAFDCLRAADMV